MRLYLYLKQQKKFFIHSFDQRQSITPRRSVIIKKHNQLSNLKNDILICPAILEGSEAAGSERLVDYIYTVYNVVNNVRTRVPELFYRSRIGQL